GSFEPPAGGDGFGRRAAPPSPRVLVTGRVSCQPPATVCRGRSRGRGGPDRPSNAVRTGPLTGGGEPRRGTGREGAVAGVDRWAGRAHGRRRSRRAGERQSADPRCGRRP